MASHNVSHQGTVRGSVMLPVESASDGEAGYKTALSEAASDGGSNSHDPPPKYSHQASQSQHHGSSEEEEEEDDELEVEELPDDYEEPQTAQGGSGLRKKTAMDSPAYVAPIGRIPSIPSIKPVSPVAPSKSPAEESMPKPKKTPVHEMPKDHLVGKTIDEFGDILDKNGTVLGRVEGDLPSMIGRSISNARGDVLGDDGELLGYVAEVEMGQGEQKSSQEQVPTWSLTEVMQAMAAAGKGPGGLRVDPFGNILDGEGNFVGSFHDNVSGFGKKNAPANGENTPISHGKEKKSRSRAPKNNSTPQKEETETNAEPSSQSEPRENAQNHRREDPKESPSDIFLDVKSTTEGIQLTIRIPTVFNSGGQPAQPKIVFS